jgi:hypothetical protein
MSKVSEGFLILGPAAVVLFFSPSQETNGIGRAEVRGEGKTSALRQGHRL